jgi:hypothetical protein
MPRPLVLIHGYSADAKALQPLQQALTARGIQASNINICNYISLNNEITIKDIAEALDRAFRMNPLLAGDDQEFDAIVHSTGMLVIRSWLTNYGAAVSANRRLRRLKHLVGVAPATWGSPQAHKGRTWLGALVKGNRQLGPDFLNAGDQVLDGLELGSKFTWDLAHADLLDDEPYYDKGGATPWVTVFIGNHPYDGIASIANEPGTDGTVRWAGCGLNTRKITIDLTRTPIGADGKVAPRASISPWAVNRLDVPLIAVEGRNHATLVSDPDPRMTELIADFLRIGDEGGKSFDDWLTAANAYGSGALPKMLVDPGNGDALEGWQQFVVHARDERGDGISDYLIEVLSPDENGEWQLFRQMYTDVHPYGADQSYRCFHIRLPKGICNGAIPLRIRIHASTGTDLMVYQGYGSDDSKQMTATSGPVDLDISNLGEGAKLFYPFTTTLIEVVLNREPWPLDQISRLMQWWTPGQG